MARLGIDKAFMEDYSKLEKPVQAAVLAAMDKFAEHTYAGLHLEKVNQAKDDRLRTIRIDLNWRGVVLAPDDGDTYYLLRVLPHNKAYEYAKRHKLTINQALGVIDIHDEADREDRQLALEEVASTTDSRLFEHVSDSDLDQLGVDDNTRTIARLLTTEAHLEAMQAMIPEVQYLALLGLAAGQTPEEVWAEISQYAPSAIDKEPIDTTNIAKALERTPSRVAIVDSADELDRILKHPFAQWRTFLHPAQRKVAYAPRYAGPVQVTGGAGTGKTVTALHRAAHLAKQAGSQLSSDTDQTSKPILITTFTNALADALKAQFAMLAEENIQKFVHISTVDSLAYQIVAVSRGRNPAPIEGKELEAVWGKGAGTTGPFGWSFLEREWEQVILAQDITTEQEYLTCSRAGQGTPLGKSQRREAWRLTRQLEHELKAMGRDTFTQLADEAARVMRVQGPLYRHVIVDEAQDLHSAQWRLLRSLVPNEPDDLFLVGDPHQRIYDNRVSLAKLGINVKGRGKKLRINYRTTQEILALAVPALGRAPVTGLDDEADTLVGYRSPLHGRRPKVIAARVWEAELAALVKQVQAWLAEGIEPHAVGVAARTGYLHREASEALAAAGISTVKLSAKSRPDAVRVGTMHGMKGLEFQAVAVIGVSDGIMPAPNAVTAASEDPVAHAQDLQRERCLLFVACTRARDHLYVSYNGTPSRFLSGT